MTGVGVGALLAVVVMSGILLHKQRPEGESGEAAEALAHQIEAAVDREAWERTRALTWTFGGRNTHLWDRDRELEQVTWKKGGHSLVVQVDLGAPSRGLAFRDERPLSPEETAPLLKRAYAHWINDSFWLNPLVKLFDAGTTRRKVQTDEGVQGLLLEYSSGGLTPGDAYLYILDAANRPIAWRMWVSIIPVGGVRASWEGWTQLSTGAWVSTRHITPVYTLELTDVRGAESLSALLGDEDPFESLVALPPVK